MPITAAGESRPVRAVWTVPPNCAPGQALMVVGKPALAVEPPPGRSDPPSAEPGRIQGHKQLLPTERRKPRPAPRGVPWAAAASFILRETKLRQRDPILASTAANRRSSRAAVVLM